MDYISGKGSIDTAATAMAEDIKAAFQTGELSGPEIVNLQSALMDIVGDADLAGAYMRQGIDTTAKIGEGSSNIVITEGKTSEITEGKEPYIDRGEGTGDNDKNNLNDTLNKNKADPARDILGSGKASHPKEWNRIINVLKQNGVDVVLDYDYGRMGYAPIKGKPGQLIIDPDASITALVHEYQHYLDNKEMGFPGQQILYSDMEVRIELERRAYTTEIDFLHDMGYYDADTQLMENFEEEKKKIQGLFNFE